MGRLKRMNVTRNRNGQVWLISVAKSRFRQPDFMFFRYWSPCGQGLRPKAGSAGGMSAVEVKPLQKGNTLKARNEKNKKHMAAPRACAASAPR